jgi:molybdenum cofactor sulfurtransferase
MFGYPTGVGALLVRRPVLAKLKRPWFAGGTVNFVSVQAPAHVLAPNEAGFEDGTLNYLSIPAVEIGLRYLEAIGLETIGERVRFLSGWLLEELFALRHSNGRPVVHIYGPVSTQARGGTITLNLYDPQGACSTTAASRNSPGTRASHFAPVASATPGPGRLPRR